MGQSESHGVQRPAGEECLPASGFYGAMELEDRFSGPSTCFRMPGSNSDAAVCPSAMFEQRCAAVCLARCVWLSESTAAASFQIIPGPGETFILSLHHG